MFGKLKQLVGMVGIDVSVELEQEQLSLNDSSINGVIHVSAKQEQVITSVKAQMQQKIMEGTGQDRRWRDYYIGEEVATSTTFTIKPGETKDFPFTLEFNRRKTFDQSMSERGGVLGALGSVGKMMDNERDTFWVNAVADVKGAALDPNDSKEVWFR